MKKTISTSTAYFDASQIIRLFIRNKMLLDHKIKNQHFNIGGNMSDELISFASITINNIN